MKYRVTRYDGRSAVMEADCYERDGSGTRLFNRGEDGQRTEVASWSDGVIKAVEPEGVEWGTASAQEG